MDLIQSCQILIYGTRLLKKYSGAIYHCYIIAFSYTHLDVYKRQGLTLRLREQFLPVVNDVWQINGIPARPSVITAVISCFKSAAELDDHSVRFAH